jgi:hypothetical protein
MRQPVRHPQGRLRFLHRLRRGGELRLTASVPATCPAIPPATARCWSKAKGLAFIGDIDLTGFGPYYGDRTSSLAAFRRSLREVAELDARIWVTSHHRAVITERAQFLADLDKFAAKIDERSEKLLGYLRERPHTLAQLVQRRMLYPPGFSLPYVESAEENSIRMHLDELLAQGRVTRHGEEFAAA